MSLTSSLPNEGFVRLSQILEVIPVGKSTWWQKVANGTYPTPVKLGPRTTAWKVEDIRQLIDAIGTMENGEEVSNG